jgi:hypothetical protein
MRLIATTLLALILLAWSAATIVVEFQTAPKRAVAELLEGDPRRPWDLRYLTRVDEALDEDVWCMREAAQSNVTIRLALLDASNRSGDAAQQADALAKARATVRRALQCFPRDGNLWLRLAMIEHAHEGPTRKVGEMLLASFAGAPNDGWVIAPRILFASRMLAGGLASAEDVLRADVATFVAKGQMAEVVGLYLDADTGLRERLMAALPILADTARAAAIKEAIDAKHPAQATK